MTKPKIIDIDAELPEAPPVPTRQVKLFEREWSIQVDLNSYSVTAMLAGDANGYIGFLKNVVVEEQRRDFVDAIAAQSGLTAERLLTIVQKIMEVAAEDFPTTPSSDSSPGATTLHTARKSAARTSARTGGPSTRRR